MWTVCFFYSVIVATFRKIDSPYTGTRYWAIVVIVVMGVGFLLATSYISSISVITLRWQKETSRSGLHSVGFSVGFDQSQLNPNGLWL